MSAASLFKYLHLAYFAKPVAARPIFRTIRKIRAGHIVGIGLSDGELARKMILFARQETTRSRVRFTGIDLFELRPDSQPHLPLKQAHRILHATGARVRLVPGDPFAALARCANSLLDTDLVVIESNQLGPAMDRAWFYVPRMLHAQSLVLVEEAGTGGKEACYQVLDVAAVQQLATAATPQRRAA